MKKPKSADIEIMSPAGSFESLQAAIQGGANAVYFGIGHLNMRSRSSFNFTLRDLKKISTVCREANVRTYITLNTVIYDREIREMKKIVDAAISNGIDAIIASDHAVIQYARQGGMEVHMSTQANISNIEAVRYYSKYADVMVTARELSLDQVKGITRKIRLERITGPSGKPVQIEIFAHGALCMAISGKCYLSLDHFNASSNRGECLQLCRRPYRVFDTYGEVELEVDNEYIMSPKDLMTIDFLDRIIDAGVRVLKIEGRGRSPEYVKTVTRCYREAVDSLVSDNYSEENIMRWKEQLRTVYNRGFWNGYYLGKKLGEWTEQYGSKASRRKIYIGKVNKYFARPGVAEIKVEAQSIAVGDEYLILGPTTGVAEGKVEEIRVDGKAVQLTSKGEVCSIPIGSKLRPSDKLYKWVGATRATSQHD